MDATLRLGRALILIAVLAGTACDATGPDVREQLRRQLETHEALWVENGADSYSVRIERRCLCTDPYDVRLDVVDGQIASGVHVFSGDALTAAELAEQLAIPDLFAVVEDALDRRVAGISVNYNQDVGYVQRLYVDYDGGSTGDDVEFLVSEYTPADSA